MIVNDFSLQLFSVVIVPRDFFSFCDETKNSIGYDNNRQPHI